MYAELFVDLKQKSAVGGTTLVSDVGLGRHSGTFIFLRIVMGRGKQTALRDSETGSLSILLSYRCLHLTAPNPMPYTVPGAE